MLLILIVLIAGCLAFPDSSFDPREATIETVHDALLSGSTCREVVSSYIARIEVLNPTLNALTSLNPRALGEADELDSRLAAGNLTGPLFCVPIILKDSYDVAGMKSSGGSLALADLQPTVDAEVVKLLKAAGAVVLGKANQHEMALEGLTISSLGGQTFNPYDLTRTPGGSSGGTGAAVAASFSVFGTGGDTMNSLRSPASANNLYSIRPTRGLISTTGTMPVSKTQDVVGPIARNVRDLAIGLSVMAGSDYTNLKGSLVGMRIGLLEGYMNQSSSIETDPVNRVMKDAIATLEAAGATVIPLNSAAFDVPTLLSTLDVQKYEFQEEMDEYLQRPSLQGDFPRSLRELYAREDFLVMPAQYAHIQACLRSSTANASYARALEGIGRLTDDLARTYTSNNLTALIYPQQRNLVVKVGSPSQAGRNGILAALTGFPSITVPAGFSSDGIPIGMEMLGLPQREGVLLQMAAQWEELSPNAKRVTPPMASEDIETKAYRAVPLIVPRRETLMDVYPLGRIGDD